MDESDVYEVDIDALSTSWTDTRVVLCPGQAVGAEASGTPYFDWPVNSTSPGGIGHSGIDGEYASSGPFSSRYGLELLFLRDGETPQKAPNGRGDPENQNPEGVSQTTAVCVTTASSYGPFGDHTRVWAIFNDDRYDDNFGSFHLTLTKGVCPRPSPPNPVTWNGECTGGSVTLSWPSIDGADGYAVYQDDDVNPVKAVTVPTATIGGLTVGQSYLFAVTTTTCCGESDPSPPLAVTPCIDCAPPSAPGRVTWSGVCEGCRATVSASVPEGATFLRFTAVAGSESKSKTVYVTDGAMTATGTITGLTINRTYRVRAVAGSACGDSPPGPGMDVRPCCACHWEGAPSPTGNWIMVPGRC